MTTTCQPETTTLTTQERQLLCDLTATGAYIERVYGRYFLRLKLIPQYRKLVAGALVSTLCEQKLIYQNVPETPHGWPTWVMNEFSPYIGERPAAGRRNPLGGEFEAQFNLRHTELNQ